MFKFKKKLIFLLCIFLIIFNCSLSYALTPEEYRTILDQHDSEWLWRFYVGDYENGRYECQKVIKDKYGYESYDDFNKNAEESEKHKIIADWCVEQFITRHEIYESHEAVRIASDIKFLMTRIQGDLDAAISDSDSFDFNDLSASQQKSFNKWYKETMFTSDGIPEFVVSGNIYGYSHDKLKRAWETLDQKYKDKFRDYCAENWLLSKKQERIIESETTNSNNNTKTNSSSKSNNYNDFNNTTISNNSNNKISFYYDYYKLFGKNRNTVDIDYTPSNIFNNEFYNEGIYINTNDTINEIEITFDYIVNQDNNGNNLNAKHNFVYGLQNNIYSIIKLLFKIDPNCSLGTLFVANDMYGTKTIYLKTNRYMAYMSGFLNKTPEDDIREFAVFKLQPLNIYCYDYDTEDHSKSDYFNAVLGSNACQYMCTFTKNSINLLSGLILIDNTTNDGLNISLQ